MSSWHSLSPKLQNFEIAFSAHTSGCRRECRCGRVFYNPDGGWTWEDGEIERLNKSDAIALPHSVGTIIFEEKEFVADCSCWHPRAEKLINWIDSHAEGIAIYLTQEKKRKQSEAEKAPTVGE